jgi:hypothetical protein
LEFLNSDDEILQSEAVTALASSAQIFENHMDQFYEKSMQVLKKILYSFDWSHTIKNKAIEAISSITMSVRNEQLTTDAHEIMEKIIITRICVEYAFFIDLISRDFAAFECS